MRPRERERNEEDGNVLNEDLWIFNSIKKIPFKFLFENYRLIERTKGKQIVLFFKIGMMAFIITSRIVVLGFMGFS